MPARSGRVSGKAPPDAGGHPVVVAQIRRRVRVAEIQDRLGQVVGDVATPPRNDLRSGRQPDQAPHHLRRHARIPRHTTENPATTLRVIHDGHLHDGHLHDR